MVNAVITVNPGLIIEDVVNYQLHSDVTMEDTKAVIFFD